MFTSLIHELLCGGLVRRGCECVLFSAACLEPLPGWMRFFRKETTRKGGSHGLRTRRIVVAIGHTAPHHHPVGAVLAPLKVARYWLTPCRKRPLGGAQTPGGEAPGFGLGRSGSFVGRVMAQPKKLTRARNNLRSAH